MLPFSLLTLIISACSFSPSWARPVTSPTPDGHIIVPRADLTFHQVAVPSGDSAWTIVVNTFRASNDTSPSSYYPAKTLFQVSCNEALTHGNLAGRGIAANSFDYIYQSDSSDVSANALCASASNPYSPNNVDDITLFIWNNFVYPILAPGSPTHNDAALNNKELIGVTAADFCSRFVPMCDQLLPNDSWDMENKVNSCNPGQGSMVVSAECSAVGAHGTGPRFTGMVTNLLVCTSQPR